MPLQSGLWRGMGESEVVHELVDHPARDEYVLAGCNQRSRSHRSVQSAVAMPLW